MDLVFIHGKPAVGKLTVARELARLSGFRLFHNHLTVDLLESVFEFGSEPFVVLREQIWLSVFHHAAVSGISLIFTFAPERTVRDQFIQDMLAIVQRSGGKVHFLELRCSDEEELERRITDASRKEFGKLISVERYRELQAKGAWAYPKLPDSGLVIDTCQMSSETASRHIVKFLSLHPEAGE